MINYEIIDDFLFDDDANRIYNFMLNGFNGPHDDKIMFPWYYNNGITSHDDRNESIHHHQFIHNFYNNRGVSPSIELISPIVKKLKVQSWQRIKANLNPVTTNKVVYPWHVDFESDDTLNKTAIYYVNSNNGVTILQDGTKIESIANRLIIFDQKILHTGTTCTDQKVRCLINFNFTTYDD